MATADDLADFAALAGLTAAQRDAVSRTAREVDLRPGSVLIEEGGPASGCWLIRSGTVRLTSRVPGRGDVVVQTLGGGDILGWSWLTPQRRWQFTATAAASVKAVRLDTDRLLALAAADPALGYALLGGIVNALSGRLHATRARLLDRFGNPRAR